MVRSRGSSLSFESVGIDTFIVESRIRKNSKMFPLCNFVRDGNARVCYKHVRMRVVIWPIANIPVDTAR